mmetsp:Transcript_13675/g.39965  ORF Transcript_13675/g.39965 Transcript_13675/m.39965 type:complete len:180 (-) Transcript_13675:209-748(-)
MTRQVGTVTKWLNHRGIGFITPEGESTEIGKDLLVHYSNIKQDNNGGDTFKSLADGSTVEYDTAVDPKNPNKVIAVNVTSIGGGDCERRNGRGGPRNVANGANREGFYLVVGNLKEGTSWRELKDLFRSCGDVDFVTVKKDGDGVVRFNKEEDANHALETLHGYSFNGQDIEVRYQMKD